MGKTIHWKLHWLWKILDKKKRTHTHIVYFVTPMNQHINKSYDHKSTYPCTRFIFNFRRGKKKIFRRRKYGKRFAREIFHGIYKYTYEKAHHIFIVIGEKKSIVICWSAVQMGGTKCTKNSQSSSLLFFLLISVIPMKIVCAIDRFFIFSAKIYMAFVYHQIGWALSNWTEPAHASKCNILGIFSVELWIHILYVRYEYISAYIVITLRKCKP